MPCEDHQSLLALIERVAALDRLVIEKFVQMRRDAEQVAINLDAYKASQNEWGRSFAGLRADFLTKNEYDARHRELDQKIESADKAAKARDDAFRDRFDERMEALGREVADVHEDVVQAQSLAMGASQQRSRFYATVALSCTLVGTLVGVVVAVAAKL